MFQLEQSSVCLMTAVLIPATQSESKLEADLKDFTIAYKVCRTEQDSAESCNARGND